MDQTQSNLERLQDLKAEIHKNLKALEDQADKARKARTLKEKIRRQDLVVTGDKVYGLLHSFFEGQKRKTFLHNELEDLETQKQKIDAELSEDRLRKDELSDALEEKQTELNEKGKLLAAAEERLHFLKQSIEEKKKSCGDKESEQQQISEDSKAIAEQRDQAKLQLDELLRQQETPLDLKEFESDVEEKRKAYEDIRQKVRESQQQLNEREKQRYQIERDYERTTEKIATVSEQLQECEAELKKREIDSSQFSAQLLQLRESVEQKQASYETTQDQKDQLHVDIKRQKGLLSELDLKLHQTQKELMQKKAQKDSLESLNSSHAGCSNQVQKIQEKLGSNLKIFGEWIKVSEELRPAVEAVLGETLQSVMIETAQSTELAEFVEQAISAHLWMAAYSAEISGESLDLSSLDDFVEVNEEQGQVPTSIKAYLSQFYVWDGPELPGDDVFKKMSQTAQGVVDRNGEWAFLCHPGGIRFQTFFQENEEQSFLSRQNAIEDLSAELASLEEKLEGIQKESVEKKDHLASLEKDLSDTEAQFTPLVRELSVAQEQLRSKEEGLKTGGERLEKLTQKKQELSSQRIVLVEKEDELSRNKLDASEKLETLQRRISDQLQEREQKEQTFESRREELAAQQVELRTFETKKSAITDKISSLEKQQLSLTQRSANLKTAVSELREQIESNAQEVQHLKNSNEQQSEEIQKLEDARAQLADELEELLNATQEQEEQGRQIAKKTGQFEKELATLDVKLDQLLTDEEFISRDCFEKYRVDLRGEILSFLKIGNEKELLLPLAVENTQPDASKIETEPFEFKERNKSVIKDFKERLKSNKAQLTRLGEINWQAIDDYQKQKQRYDFLREQEEVLRTSLADLNNAIEHIDKKSKIRFREAYKEVDQKFSQVFPIIFGGGSAKLQLKGTLDDADAGIEIIAQPPGKKMQNINLMSGGEKALTAVSLIFSIFLVKPSPFCLLDEVDAPLDDANVGRFNDLLREMSEESQFILITHNKRTMELNDTLYGITMQEPGISTAVSVELQ